MTRRLWSTLTWRRTVVLLIALTGWFMPPPDGLTQQAWHLFVIFAGGIAAVITNATTILLAAIRIPDLLTPLTEIGQALKAGALRGGEQFAEQAVIEPSGTEGAASDPQRGKPGAATDA